MADVIKKRVRFIKRGRGQPTINHEHYYVVSTPPINKGGLQKGIKE